MTVWQVQVPSTGYEWEGPLEADWEVDLSAISDNHTPEEIDANSLFEIWAEKVRQHYPKGLVPISWTARSPGHDMPMPFQFQDVPEDNEQEDFLNIYTWPICKKTGERLNWLALPVIDRFWKKGRADKGGFIQEATGWKPGILQSSVFLPSLLEGADLVLRRSLNGRR